MVKVSRQGKVHTVREVDVAIALEGDFGAIHTRGDNANCLPTDTMKNTVYALGKDHPLDTIEEFALHLARHFLDEHRPVSSARVRISQVPWKRVKTRAWEHPHCFLKGSEERRTCDVVLGRGKTNARAIGGIEGLVILKSTDSAFTGYPKTRFTTLPEARDRIFCTSVTATWTYGSTRAKFGACRDAIRRALIDTFAAHKSESVQQTLFEMGAAALRACQSIDSIRLSMPNKHCLLVNLKPFGLENANEVFVPTDEPHGLIEATVTRG
jgi:urate oxidase